MQKHIFIWLAVAFMSACDASLFLFLQMDSGPAFSANRMTVSTEQDNERKYLEYYRSSIYVQDVSGVESLDYGYEFTPLGDKPSVITEALRASLKSAGLLSISEKASKYTLTTTILGGKIAGPMDITATITIQYNLVEKNNSKIIFTNSITTSYISKHKDEYKYKTRIESAIQGSIRENFLSLFDLFKQSS